MAEPRGTGADRAVVGDGADADQDVARQSLPRGYHRVVAEEGVAAELYARQRDRALLDPRPAEVDPVGEEGVRADLDKLGDNVDDCADLAATPHRHAGPAQPGRPEKPTAEPVAGGVDQVGLEPDLEVGQAPPADDLLVESAESPDGYRLQRHRGD